jgi:eukaryotic-like serine/threonine-protein kinase
MSTAPTESPRFFGRYELVHLLGQGGMGEVYLAKLSGAAGFEKPCIVKTILPGLVKDRQFLDRFHHEAKVLVHLVHSSIAQVYDMGEADGTYYMALEYVAGVDLGYLLEQARVQGRAVPVPVALYIGQRIAEGLGYAHRKTGTDGEPLGIVHRDVSPHNVMVSYEGEVKVIDFGLAKSTARSKYTLPSTVMGKLGYMSPEQVRAEPLDHRSDIYSCGVVVWEMLAGRGLVPHGTVGEMMAAMSNPVVPSLGEQRPDVEPSLEAVVRRALTPSPAERYARADEFARALNAELLRTASPVGAEEVGEFVRALCPEAYAEQRKLTSAVHGERRTPPPASRSGSGTGMYGDVAKAPEDGAAYDATALRTVEPAPQDGARPNTGRIDVGGAAATTGPGGTFVSHPGSGGVARSTDTVDSAALGATAVHRPVSQPVPPVQAVPEPAPVKRSPVGRIAVAALLLVGATVAVTTFALRSGTGTSVGPRVAPPVSEPVVVAPPKEAPKEEPTVVAPPEEPVAEAPSPDAGAVVVEKPVTKPAPVTKPKPPVVTLVAVPPRAVVEEIKETGSGQRVVDVSVPKDVKSGTVFQVVGPRQRGSNKRQLLGTASVNYIRQPNRDRLVLNLDAAAEASQERRFVLLSKRPAVAVEEPAPAPEPTPVAEPVREEKPTPAAPSRLLGEARLEGTFSKTLILTNSDTRGWNNCTIVLSQKRQATMMHLKPYSNHTVEVSKNYFKTWVSAPTVPDKAVRVICDEGAETFALR